jgi:hypothetical protein
VIDLIDAPIVLAWGLVNADRPLADLMPCAQAPACAISRVGPVVLHRTKRLTAVEWRYPDRQARLRANITGFAGHLRGHDLRDGLAAFGAKQALASRSPEMV